MFNNGDYLTILIDGKMYNGKVELKDGTLHLMDVLKGEAGDMFARKVDGEFVTSYFLVIHTEDENQHEYA